MTVPTTNAINGPYITNGATVAFPFTFTALVADDVQVVLADANGVETVASSASYTVALNPSGGTVTFATAPAAGSDLYVLLDPDFKQEVAFENGGVFLASAHNKGFDRGALRDQALKRELDRSAKFARDVTPLPIGDLDEGQVLARVGDALVGIDNDPAGSEASAQRAETAMAVVLAAQAEVALYVATLPAPAPDPFAAYNQYYVDAAASGSGNGSIGNPWTWAQAAAVSGSNPAGLTFPACINVNAGTYLNQSENVRVTGQSATAPIVFRGTPGQAKPVFRSAASVTWTRVIDEVGRQVYESNEAFSAGSAMLFGGHIKLGGEWYPLPVITQARLESTTGQTYRVDGNYYPGPCLARIQATGKFRIRLDPPTSAAQMGSLRTFATTVSTDPAANEIIIDTGKFGFKPFSGHMKFYGLRVENHYTGFGMNAVGGPFEGIEIVDCEFMPTYSGINLGRLKNAKIDGCLLDGRLRRDWWGCYADIKGGQTIIEGTRKVAVTSSGPGANFTDGAKFTRCNMTGFFDGFLGEGHNIEVGGYDPYDPNSDLKAWAFANTIDCWDDAAQIFSHNQGFHAHHNFLTGAGFSRDGAGSSADRGSNWPLLYRNICWPQEMLFYGRQGAIDGSGVNGWEGLVYPPGISSHGIRTGAGNYRYPWHFIGNTVVVRLPDVITGPPSFGTRSINMNLGLSSATLHSGGRNIIADNIFVLDGLDELRAASLALSHPGGFSAWVTQDMYLGRNDEIFDGNAFLGPWGNWSSVATGSVEDYFHIRTVRNAAGTTIGERFSWAEMAADATMLGLMQTNYSAAYQQSTVEFPAGNRATEILNPITYQPLTSSGLSSGGVDLTSLVPGWRVWMPGRGAKWS